MAVGSGQTRPVVLRGNSGSGLSAVAKALRAAGGPEMAWVSQDLVRLVILKERDRLGAVSIGLDLLATIREHDIPETSIA